MGRKSRSNSGRTQEKIVAVLADRLRDLRLERNETQGSIADMLSLSRTSYCKYETGEHQPNLRVLDILADHYEVTVDYLIGRSEIRNYSENINAEEDEILTQYKNSEDKEVLKKLWDYSEWYNLTPAEKQLIDGYRSSNKSGQTAIRDFADFMASKKKSNNEPNEE